MTRLAIILSLLLLWHKQSTAQKIFLKSYQLGYTITDRDPFRNNPSNLAPLLKNQAEYISLINSINHNGIYGNPAIEKIKSISFAIELSKNNLHSFFWKHFTISLGAGISGKIRKDGMGLNNRNVFNYDTLNHRKIESTLWITNFSQQINFTGGLNYKVKIFNGVRFTTGIIFQPNLTLNNCFDMQIDSIFFKKNTGIIIKNGNITTMEGVPVFSFNLYIPAGVEVDVYKQQFFIQSTFNAGFLFSRYYLDQNKKEANGFGFSLIYKPTKVVNTEKRSRL